MNTATIQPITTKPVTTAFWSGFDAYCKGALLEDMQTHEQRNGWWFALKCQGDTVELEDNMQDRAFWARGMY